MDGWVTGNVKHLTRVLARKDSACLGVSAEKQNVLTQSGSQSDDRHQTAHVWLMPNRRWGERRITQTNLSSVGR